MIGALLCKLGVHKRANWRKANIKRGKGIAVASEWTCSRCGHVGLEVLPRRRR